MHLLNDIKKDQHFKNVTKTIAFVFIAFFILDTLIGVVLTHGLEKYYGLNTDAEIALVGHSQLMLGVDKSLLESELGVSVAKYTREGVPIADRQIMIRQLLKQNDNLKTVIYGVDNWSFTREGLSSNSYTLFYPFLENKEVDSYVRGQAGVSNYWLHKLVKTTRFNEMLISGSFRGYLGNWTNLKFGQVDILNLKREIAEGNFRRINNLTQNINILTQTIKELEDKNIKVILLYLPSIDLLNSAEPTKIKETFDILYNLDKEFSNVIIFNYSKPYSHDYSLFFDPIHMNPKGQELVTKRLIDDLKDNF